MSKRFFMLAAVIALTVIAALVLVNQKTPVPSVQGPSLSGQVVDTQTLKGKPYLINFWATSCVTCVKEMPDLKALQTQFSDQGFQVVAIAMAYDKPEFVERFAQERGLPFVFLHDQDGRWARAFGDVAVTPTTFLIDAKGQMLKRYVGQPDFKQLTSLVRDLL
jgi:peroxiredoxin